MYASATFQYVAGYILYFGSTYIWFLFFMQEILIFYSLCSKYYLAMCEKFHIVKVPLLPYYFIEIFWVDWLVQTLNVCTCWKEVLSWSMKANYDSLFLQSLLTFSPCEFTDYAIQEALDSSSKIVQNFKIFFKKTNCLLHWGQIFVMAWAIPSKK